MNRWAAAAAVLGSCGAVLAAFSFFVLGSVPLTALGLGAVVTAASLALTPCESPYREATLSMLKAYTANISRVLEELAAQPGAVYTPGGIVAVPLKQASRFEGEPDSSRLIWKSAGGYFLILSSPGYGAERGTDLEAALELVLVDTLGLCDGVRVIARERTILVEVLGARESGEPSRFSRVLGPLPVHVAAAVVAQVGGLPVRVESWERRGENILATLTAVGGSAQEG